MSVAITAAVQGILSTSYVWWQNTESVTLTVAGSAPEQSYTVTNCKRFDVSDRDLPAQKQGGLVAFDLVWLLPVATLGGVVPKVADIITPSSGVEFTIQDLNQNGWRTWFKATARNLKLALGLSDLIGFWRPNYSNAGGTRSIAGYVPFMLAIPAKIVEIGDDYSPDLLGKRQAKQRYEIHSAKFVRWEPGDQIRDQNGTIFQIVGSTTPNTIDSLNLFTCERIL